MEEKVLGKIEKGEGKATRYGLEALERRIILLEELEGRKEKRGIIRSVKAEIDDLKLKVDALANHLGLKLEGPQMQYNLKPKEPADEGIRAITDGGTAEGIAPSTDRKPE